MCSLICSIAPARKVSEAATTTVIWFCLSRYANFASVVVLPVPFMPRNTIRYGKPVAFFLFIRSITSMASPSNWADIDSLRAPLTNFSTSFFPTLVPTSLRLSDLFMLSITSTATSDCNNDNSSVSSMSSMSDSVRSLSTIVLVKPFSVLRSLSNMSVSGSSIYHLSQLPI